MEDNKSVDICERNLVQPPRRVPTVYYCTIFFAGRLDAPTTHPEFQQEQHQHPYCLLSDYKKGAKNLDGDETSMRSLRVL